MGQSSRVGAWLALDFHLSSTLLRVIDKSSGKEMGTVRRLLIRGGIKSA